MFLVDGQPVKKIATCVSDGFLLFDCQPRRPTDSIRGKAGIPAMSVAVKRALTPGAIVRYGGAVLTRSQTFALGAKNNEQNRPQLGVKTNQKAGITNLG
eukprot:IDg20460t1